MIDRDYDNFLNIKVGINGNNMDIEIFTQERVSKSKLRFNLQKYEHTAIYSDIMKFFQSDELKKIIFEDISKTIKEESK